MEDAKPWLFLQKINKYRFLDLSLCWLRCHRMRMTKCVAGIFLGSVNLACLSQAQKVPWWIKGRIFVVDVVFPIITAPVLITNCFIIMIKQWNAIAHLIVVFSAERAFVGTVGHASCLLYDWDWSGLICQIKSNSKMNRAVGSNCY